ncbi:SDR family oxidoreductase [Adhaeretor mobilis]|uniref:UDP-glucose 4-epimerase n=1 Tax=Adhaeretor mobilis TaxID=1930276 RepID=A0A517MSS3_9BACT|nr:SDR family oxidoreductase [Adhaeretor mobilis]QDS97940.1 UDP-glucose 4-epimerase [Adhaeretor mobilis]
MSTSLVTGGAGFIGSHIASALVERGDRVRVLDNFSTGQQSNLAHIADSVEVFDADILSEDDLDRAVRGVDVVFHEAALASVPRSVAEPMRSFQQCATGTVMVLDAARRAGVERVVFAASSACYGNQSTAAKRESDPATPLSPYAAGKVASEMFLKAFAESYGMQTVALRYFNVFGPRQDPEGEYSAVIPKFVTRMISGEQPIVFGTGRQSRDFVYVGDVVAANLLAAEATGVAGGVFNVGCGRQTDLLDLIQAINNSLGTSLEPIFEPARTGDVMESMADISAARRDLGYEPQIDFQTGLDLSIEYYRNVG